jgi:hypothetical protein
MDLIYVEIEAVRWMKYTSSALAKALSNIAKKSNTPLL